VIAVLADQWEPKSEEGWATRQVAGALACSADVHVITPQGIVPSQRVDSVFTLHETATPSSPTAAVRRELLIEAISDTGWSTTGRLLPKYGRLLDRDLLDCWSASSDILAGLRPDIVVIAGHQHLGALDAVDRVAPDVPIVLLALGSDLNSLAFPHFDRIFDRSQAVLAITETERLAIVEHHGGADRVHRIGAPLAANPSALNEPNTWVGTTDYVFVISSTKTHANEEAVALVARTKLFQLAESLGGVESLIEVPARMTHASTADAPFAAPGNLVRLSVGIEAVEDLVSDLDNALVPAAVARA